MLHIGENPPEQERELHAILFAHHRPFEKLYCICVTAFNQTWKDMYATSEDFTKVFNVVRNRLKRSFEKRPANLDDFRTQMHAIKAVFFRCRALEFKDDKLDEYDVDENTDALRKQYEEDRTNEIVDQMSMDGAERVYCTGRAPAACATAFENNDIELVTGVEVEELHRLLPNASSNRKVLTALASYKSNSIVPIFDDGRPAERKVSEPPTTPVQCKKLRLGLPRSSGKKRTVVETNENPAM